MPRIRNGQRASNIEIDKNTIANQINIIMSIMILAQNHKKQRNKCNIKVGILAPTEECFSSPNEKSHMT